MVDIIVVRQAEPKDELGVKTVESLADATLRETYLPNRAGFREKTNTALPLNRLVATIDGRVVGTLQWYVEEVCFSAVSLVDLSGSARREEALGLQSAAEEILPGSLTRIVSRVGAEMNPPLRWNMRDASVRAVCLGVHPDFRRKGIARAMLQQLETMCRELGVTRLRLHTIKQTGNAAIFTRIGFRVTSEHVNPMLESDKYPTLTIGEMERVLNGD
jgi:GNAT superfamily N-acetyltransferase